MKTYLKILLLTAAVQIGAVASCMAFYVLTGHVLRIVPLVIIAGYVASLALDIRLAWQQDAVTARKLGCIFLMPTNYSPVLLLWLGLWIFEKFFEMLPANLG